MFASHKAVALASLLVILPMQACGGAAEGGGRGGERTVIELAAALHGGHDDVALAHVLLEANGGGTEVPARVADELLAADNVAGRIVAGTSDAVDSACAAFDHGEVVLDAADPAAQHLLTDMWAQLSTGHVESDTLSLACAIHAVLAGP